jgi:hypothetical protein
MSIPSHVLVYMLDVSIMFNPVERVIEDVKKLVIIFCTGSMAPRVAGLLHSEIAIPKVPKTRSNKLAHKIILEFRDH